MTAPESFRRCQDCRRSIPGHAGNACPFCGGGHLSPITLQRTATLRHHPAVVTGAVTFCLGLVVLRTVSLALMPRLASSNAYGEMLWNLQMLVAACTVAYLILRRGEGDFKALFVITFGLFAASEGLGVLASKYGLFALQSLSMVMNITIFIYSSLTLTASLADGPSRELYQRALVGANLGFLFVSVLRVFLEIGRRSMEDENRVTTIVMLAVTLYVAQFVLRGEKGERKEPTPSAPENPRSTLIASTPQTPEPAPPAEDRKA